MNSPGAERVPLVIPRERRSINVSSGIGGHIAVMV